MESKVVLITGCNSGIGMATAVSLALDPDKKYIVYATMRTLGKRGNLEGAVGSALNDTLFIREIDVTKEETIVKVVGELKEKYGRIDVLINNAGIGHMVIMEFTDLQKFRDIMEVNFFGTVRMIQEVLPMMKQRESGRVISISSLAGLFGHPFLDSYSAAKHAMEAVTECLAIRLRDQGIWFTTVQPGPIKTGIEEKMEFNEELLENEKVDSKTKAAFKLVTDQMKYILTMADVALPVEGVVKNIRHAIEDEKPHVRYRSSDFFPWEQLKYIDKHGDDYVDAVIEGFRNPPKI